MTIDIQAQENPPETRYKDKLNEGFYVYVPRKQKIQDSFIMMFQNKLQELAAENVLTVEGWRVLVMVLGKVDFENFIRVKQVQIAEELGMKPPNVNKAFKRLIELGILEKINQDNFNGYRLSYEIGWKGKASNLKTHIKSKERAEATQTAARAKR